MPSESTHKSLETILQEAGLLSSAQIEVLRQDRKYQPHISIEEIIELRGWLQGDIIEFFAQRWPNVANGQRDEPIGYYFQQAGLLDSQQIQALLQEQAQVGMRIGALAVLRGWLSQDTVNWFLRNLAPEEYSASSFVTHHQPRPASRNRSAPAAPSGPAPQNDPEPEEIPWVD